MSSLPGSALLSFSILRRRSFSHLFSAHLNSSLFSSSQLLHSTQLVSTQLFSALHQSSPVRSSHLISAFLQFSQLFSTLLSSPQLMSAHHMSSHLFPPLLTSSKIFSHLLSSFQPFPPGNTLRLAQSTSQYCFVLWKLHNVLPSTTLYYKSCTNYFPVLLCTSKLAKRTSQYYFVLQSLHRALPSSTLHKLQRLHKVLPSTALYDKSCTTYFPVLLCTTKRAQSTSQYYFAAQSCTMYFAVLLCTTKLAQSTLHTKSFYTEKRSLYTDEAFTHSKLLHREAQHRSFYTH